MTAFGVGRELAEHELGVTASDQDLLTYVGKVLHWIPAGAIAFYTAAVTALVDDPKADPKWWLAAIAGGIAVALVVAGRLSKGIKKFISWKLPVHIGLVVVAFGIWSPTVPNSGWHEFKIIADNPGWTVIICAAAGIVFAAFSDLIKDWVEKA